MIIRDAKIEAVAVRASQYPQDNIAEIAFAGRSNVGKSSLLNLLTGRKSLARVSGSPGKTRTINFYNINDEFRIVDLPGYGYAKVSKSMSKDWGPMMEESYSSWIYAMLHRFRTCRCTNISGITVLTELS